MTNKLTLEDSSLEARMLPNGNIELFDKHQQECVELTRNDAYKLIDWLNTIHREEWREGLKSLLGD